MPQVDYPRRLFVVQLIRRGIQMNEVMQYADRITVLRDGKLVKSMKKEEPAKRNWHS